jgi:hypothetical protein
MVGSANREGLIGPRLKPTGRTDKDGPEFFAFGISDSSSRLSYARSHAMVVRHSTDGVRAFHLVATLNQWAQSAQPRNQDAFCGWRRRKP